MKKLAFTGRDENLYHKLDKQNVVATDQIITGEAIITGFTKEELAPEDILSINGTNYSIDTVIERRDHAGTFINPEDKKGTFFKVKATFQELIPQKI